MPAQLNEDIRREIIKRNVRDHKGQQALAKELDVSFSTVYLHTKNHYGLKQPFEKAKALRKLTQKQVNMILNHEITIKDAVKKFKVQPCTVYNVLHHRTWNKESELI